MAGPIRTANPPPFSPCRGGTVPGGDNVAPSGASRTDPPDTVAAVPPYPPEVMRHLAAPIGAGGTPRPDCVGEAGAEDCGDVVRIELVVRNGIVEDAGFRVRGCGATTAAASAACAALAGAPLRRALGVSASSLDSALGGLGTARLHGAQIVADAVSQALEHWYTARLGEPGLPLRPGGVAVAMSGGVDSAVAALLLADQGFDVVGVTMRLWHDPVAARAERSCCAPETVRLARETCAALGIPHLVIDAAERFRSEVVEEFARGYAAGLTPNPCITCNGEVRFRILAEAAALLGARGLATGHYARVVEGPAGSPVLATAVDGTKDQSYMLARLDRATIERLILPLGGLTKVEVRDLAAGAGLPAADAVESQDVCFVGKGGYAPFLERHAGLTPRTGEIVDMDGTVVGDHSGYWRYTVGQRKGIGVAASTPQYVIATDAARNRVVVGPRAALASFRISLHDVVAHEAPGRTLDVRIRHHDRSLRGSLRMTGEATGDVVLEEAAEAVAPGQVAALYDDGRLVAAGTIARAFAGHEQSEA
ncbi:MAG: tRNA 2-thiouridine(34) synthase MnmA [Thermoleophilia bacterium]|nr:tRNA 2-thiouridine(34) synthase MnmA [Thermoleophilia bacterium]